MAGRLCVAGAIHRVCLMTHIASSSILKLAVATLQGTAEETLAPGSPLLSAPPPWKVSCVNSHAVLYCTSYFLVYAAPESSWLARACDHVDSAATVMYSCSN